MKYNDCTYKEMKASAGLEDFINVFAERLKLETPFTCAAEACIRGFSFLYSLLVPPTAGAGITNTPLSVGSSPMKLTGLSEEWWKLGSIPNLAIKITSLKRFHLVSLQRYMKNEYYKKLALLAPATSTMINGLYKRVMAFFASCEHFRYSKRFDCWNENKSILTPCMGGDLGHGERCNNV